MIGFKEIHLTTNNALEGNVSILFVKGTMMR